MNLKAIYVVYHSYRVDGRDYPFLKNKVVHIFENSEDAEAFVEKFQNPHVYNYMIGHNPLACGDLSIVKELVIPHSEFDISKFRKEDYWWLDPKNDEAYIGP